jgi:hypothetical protein|nr:MAG: hypothetical protein [Lake Baikal virophage 10]
MTDILENACNDFLVWFPTKYKEIDFNGKKRRNIGVRWIDVYWRFRRNNFGYEKGISQSTLRKIIEERSNYKIGKCLGCSLCVLGYEDIDV